MKTANKNRHDHEGIPGERGHCKPITECSSVTFVLVPTKCRLRFSRKLVKTLSYCIILLE